MRKGLYTTLSALRYAVQHSYAIALQAPFIYRRCCRSSLSSVPFLFPFVPLLVIRHCMMVHEKHSHETRKEHSENDYQCGHLCLFCCKRTNNTIRPQKSSLIFRMRSIGTVEILQPVYEVDTKICVCIDIPNMVLVCFGFAV